MQKGSAKCTAAVRRTRQRGAQHAAGGNATGLVPRQVAYQCVSFSSTSDCRLIYIASHESSRSDSYGKMESAKDLPPLPFPEMEEDENDAKDFDAATTRPYELEGRRSVPKTKS